MKWKKPNGTEIETNNEKATIEKCVSLGWEPATEEKPKKRGRPKKVVTDGDSSGSDQAGSE